MAYGMMDGMMGYGYLGAGWLFQILIVVFFFLILWWMIKGNQNFGYHYSNQETALDILKKRLAKGEINTKEYERLKKEIEH